jgi:photosystem II stability/assembly factor-like uncharacterized protein
VWTRHNDVPEDRVRDVAISPTNPQIVYALTEVYDNPVHKSTDGGQSFQTLDGVRAPNGLIDIAVDPSDSETVYVAGSNFLKSDDGGRSWDRAEDGLTSAFTTGITFHPANSAIVFVGGGAIHKSTDGACTWRRAHGSPITVTDLAVNPSSPNVMYAGAFGSLFISVDAGETWYRRPPRPEEPMDMASVLAWVSEHPQILYGGGMEGVFKSTDGGANWQRRSVGLPELYVNDLAVPPSRPEIVYAALLEPFGVVGFVYKSTDGGGTWQRFSHGLPIRQVRRVEIDPGDPRRVWAATGAGLFSIDQLPANLGDGDANCDGPVNAADVIEQIVLLAGAARATCGFDDADADGSHDAADIDTSIARIFAAGLRPAESS